MEFHCEDQVKIVGAGETIFLPKAQAHAFYVRSAYLRTLIIALATTDKPRGARHLLCWHGGAGNQHGYSR